VKLGLRLKEFVSAGLATIRANLVAIGVFTSKGAFGGSVAKDFI
jgi:hypothetical protein